MERQTGQIPPLFQRLPGDNAPDRERNVLADIPDKLTSLERHKYKVAEELQIVIFWSIIFAAVTTWAFPFLPETVNVGGWALWGIGGTIITVMEWVAHLWIVAVVLGGLSFFLAAWLAVASRWLKEATKIEQYLMYVSVVLIIPNFLALLAIVVVWAVVVLIWGLIAFLILASIGLFIQLVSSGR
jgi:hypothetical protein